MNKKIYIFSLNDGILKLNNETLIIQKEKPPYVVEIDENEIVNLLFTPFSKNNQIFTPILMELTNPNSKCDYIKVYEISTNISILLLTPAFSTNKLICQNEEIKIYNSELELPENKHNLLGYYEKAEILERFNHKILILDNKRCIILNEENKILYDERKIKTLSNNELSVELISDYLDSQNRYKFLSISQSGVIQKVIKPKNSNLSISENNFFLSFFQSLRLNNFTDCKKYINSSLQETDKDIFFEYFNKEFLFPVYVENQFYILANDGHFVFSMEQNTINNIDFIDLK